MNSGVSCFITNSDVKLKYLLGRILGTGLLPWNRIKNFFIENRMVLLCTCKKKCIFCLKILPRKSYAIFFTQKLIFMHRTIKLIQHLELRNISVRSFFDTLPSKFFQNFHPRFVRVMYILILKNFQ